MQRDKACVYIRTACYLEDVTEEKIHSEISSCVKNIESRGLQLDKVYLDIGASGNLLLRPNLIRLFRHLLDNDISYLYVPNLSVLSSNTLDFFEIKEFLDSIEVHIVNIY